MKFEIKTDPKLPHHYIIAVGVHPATSSNPGQMFLKYRPVYFTNEDVDSMQHAAMLSKDKLFKTSSSEALDAVGCSGFAATISSLKLAAEVNQCTLHHFSSEFMIEEHWFENLVEMANTSDHNKQLLKQSSIRG